MITIVHQDDCVLVYTDETQHEFAGIVAECYARAWDKPNYPMPAIRIQGELIVGVERAYYITLVDTLKGTWQAIGLKNYRMRFW